MNILAVDPGGTTGVVAHDNNVTIPEQVSGGDLGFVEWFDRLLSEEGWVPDLVICESFIPRPGARSMQMDALYIIGYLRGWCHLHNVAFKLQSPAQAKSFSTDDKLKAAGWWVPGQDHARDSLRHLLVHLIMDEPQGPLARQIATAVLS